MRIVSLLAAASPLRFGVAAIILVTLFYSSVDIFPMISRDLQLLKDVHGVDERGIRLDGDLQNEIQESRRRFLRILLASGNPLEVENEARSMRSYDAAISVTESQIAQLGAAQMAGQQLFHARWLRYMALRDRLLATAAQGGPADVRKIDTDLGKGAFDPVEQAVRDSDMALEVSSAAHIHEVAATLQSGLVGLFGLMWIKILALGLLVWMDWRRVRAEKQLRRTTHELRASEERFHAAYETASVGMWIFKLDGTVVSANARAAQILGYEQSEVAGFNVSDLMAPECVEDQRQKFASLTLGQEHSYHSERRVIRKDGAEAWVRNSVTLLRPEGQEPYIFSVSEEITQEHEANQRLAYLANYDPVTNLINRRFFEEQLADALQLVAGKAECVALLYLEIDSFDFLKGTFGRTVADEVLQELGASLSAFRRGTDVIARLDDHTFAMMTIAAPYDEAVAARAGELREIVHRAGESGKHRIPLAASIGIAYSGDGVNCAGTMNAGEPDPRARAGAEAGSGADILLKFARAAMLEARSRGGDSIFVADPSLQERAAERHQIESALWKGLREDEFRVVFQPQFQIATGKLVRFEALCRWNSSELGPIAPDRFIPIAEQTGLISEIGRRVMLEALRQARTWVASGRKIGVAVNISPMQFMRPDFPHIITEILALSDFPPELLELEITEGIFIRDLNLAIGRIRELQRLGLSIALDDFGTGYSSLSYLQRMPIDAVKLDRSFVSDLTTDPATVSMVRSVLAMAEALHLRVVTEGVETIEQLDILRELGCDEAQGYLLGRPEPAAMALQRVMESPVQASARSYLGAAVKPFPERARERHASQNREIPRELS